MNDTSHAAAANAEARGQVMQLVRLLELDHEQLIGGLSDE